MRNFLMVMAVAFTAAFPGAAVGSEILPECTVDDDGPTNVISCGFSLTTAARLQELSLAINGNPMTEATFTPFSATGNKSAWLFLIDRSNPARASTVRRNVDLVKNLLRSADSERTMGVATFANELSLEVELSDQFTDLDTRLADVKADGAATEFFATSIEAIKILSSSQAERKALVIMSDGKAEDTAYTRADVVAAAEEAGVVIIGMGFAERASETPHLQEIRRLAEETKGPFISVIGNEPIPADFLSSLTRYVESGGVIKSPLTGLSGELEVSLTATLADDSTLTSTMTVDVPAPPPPPPPPELSTIAKIFSAFDGLVPGASVWAQENASAAIAVLVLLPLLLLLALFLLFRKNAGPEADAELDETPATGIVEPLGEPGTRAISGGLDAPLGYFVMVDNQDNRFEIREQSVSIGRHSENEFQLNNDSVHRHHAHFHFSPDNEPTITDLDTANGVHVNGKKITNVELKSGDLIELGEVRFRYMDGNS